MPTKLRKTCIRCGGSNWLKWKHWLICLDCEPEYEAYHTPALPKPELFDKGIPKPRRHP